MTTSAMLWGGAAYNNGIVPAKRYIFGESYSSRRSSRRSSTPCRRRPPRSRPRACCRSSCRCRRWNVAQPPDPLRAFERGGRIDRSIVSEVGNPGPRALPRLPGQARHEVRHARARHRPPHQRRRPQHPQDAPQRPAPVVPRHQRPPGRLPLERLYRRATSSTPTTATPSTRDPTPSTATTAATTARTRRSRRTSPAIRSSTG